LALALNSFVERDEILGPLGDGHERIDFEWLMRTTATALLTTT
jgi:hypothetical protein